MNAVFEPVNDGFVASLDALPIRFVPAAPERVLDVLARPFDDLKVIKVADGLDARAFSRRALGARPGELLTWVVYQRVFVAERARVQQLRPPGSENPPT